MFSIVAVYLLLEVINLCTALQDCISTQVIVDGITIIFVSEEMNISQASKHCESLGAVLMEAWLPSVRKSAADYIKYVKIAYKWCDHKIT